MKNAFQFPVIFSMMLLVAIGVTAQPSAGFQTATAAVWGKIVTASIAETNNLPVDPNLKCLPTTGKVTVCALLRPGQYHMYYREGARGHTQTAVMGGFPWVFEPTDTKTKFGAKTKTSARFCQFLGLDTTEPRDTIVYLEVDVKDLFRPSYHTDVTSKNAMAGNHQYTLSSNNPDIINWFHRELGSNTSPWTRIGYTYDWGPGVVANNIGATEFILKKGSNYKCVDQGGTDSWVGGNKKRYYKLVSDYLK